jgi:cold shock CspA family protein
MAKTQETFNKKEKEKKRLKKRQDKLIKKDERRSSSEGGAFENMLAYVDENGMISDTPPDPLKKKKINASLIEIGIPKQEDSGPVSYSGKIDFYNTDKGFGFIRDLKSQEKYFFHVNGLLQPVQEGDSVTFELEKGLKGMNCIKVKK